MARPDQDSLTEALRAAAKAGARRVTVQPDGTVVVEFPEPVQVGPVWPGAVLPDVATPRPDNGIAPFDLLPPDTVFTPTQWIVVGDPLKAEWSAGSTTWS